VYTSVTNGGDILYQESSTASISFGAPLLLISGLNNNATSTHQNFSTEVVILASDEAQVVGVLASDSPAPAPVLAATLAVNTSLGEVSLQKELTAFPNPFTSKATLSFAVPAGGDYSLTLYESKRMDVVYQQQGQAQVGGLTQIEVTGEKLARGLYFARLQTSAGTKTLRLILDK
jgi:hypothetical protein